MDPEFVTAQEAAQLLGVSVPTIYAYVSRKRIRSSALPGSREHRYWKADVDLLRAQERRPKPIAGDVRPESETTLITERGPYYRGRSAIDLSQDATLEYVAALLWEVDEDEIFGGELPAIPADFAKISAAVAGATTVDRASALFPFIEHANPLSYDLSPKGMARTGAHVLRWLAAIMLRTDEPSKDPLHVQIGRATGAPAEVVDLVRRLLVLSADHGYEPGTFAVRATASTGVTPWRSVLTGLSIATGRRSRFGHFDGLRRFVSEVLLESDPRAPVVRRLKEGEVIPGFDSPIYVDGDPRGAALLEACEQACGDEPGFRNLRVAIDMVEQVNGAKPNFAIVSTYVSTRLGPIFNSSQQHVGLSSGNAPFLLARTSGWIAHAIEQYKAGESERRSLLYRGPLPGVHKSRPKDL